MHFIDWMTGNGFEGNEITKDTWRADTIRVVCLCKFCYYTINKALYNLTEILTYLGSLSSRNKLFFERKS